MMIKVSISTYGSVNKKSGWHLKELTLKQAKATVDDVLKSTSLEDGTVMFDIVADNDGVKKDYSILLNGRPLWNPKDLKSEIKSGDLITATGILEMLGGG
ncbi:hypothetical protein ACFLTK_04325 [Chloroflexota bacterium]